MRPATAPKCPAADSQDIFVGNDALLFAEEPIPAVGDSPAPAPTQADTGALSSPEGAITRAVRACQHTTFANK